MAARAQDLDWFTDIEMDGRTLPEHEAAIARLPGRLVIDHIGKFLQPMPLDHPAVAVLMRLVDSGRTYVKIASPYDSSRSGPPDYADLAPLVALLVRAAPERLIWASNWPHAALAVDQRPDDAAWVDLMSEWMRGGCSAENVRRHAGRAVRILTDDRKCDTHGRWAPSPLWGRVGEGVPTCRLTSLIAESPSRRASRVDLPHKRGRYGTARAAPLPSYSI